MKIMFLPLLVLCFTACVSSHKPTNTPGYFGGIQMGEELYGLTYKDKKGQMSFEIHNLTQHYVKIRDIRSEGWIELKPFPHGVYIEKKIVLGHLKELYELEGIFCDKKGRRINDDVWKTRVFINPERFAEDSRYIKRNLINVTQ